MPSILSQGNERAPIRGVPFVRQSGHPVRGQVRKLDCVNPFTGDDQGDRSGAREGVLDYGGRTVGRDERLHLGERHRRNRLVRVELRVGFVDRIQRTVFIR